MYEIPKYERYESSSSLKTIQNMPQLSREEIEKEFRAYDIECNRLDDDDKKSTSIEITTRPKSISSYSVKRQSLNSIKAKKMAKHLNREKVWKI